MSKIYYKYAGYYDLIFRDKDYEAESLYIQKQFCRFTRNLPKKVCDMGCGTGRHAEYLIKLGYQMFCVDNSPEMIAITKQRLEGLANVKLICENDENVQLPVKVSCIISMFSTFNHKLTDHQAIKTLANYHKNLIPKGLLLIEMVDKEYFLESLRQWGEKNRSSSTRRFQTGVEGGQVTIVKLADKYAVWSAEIAHITKRYSVLEAQHARQCEFVDEFPLRFYTMPEIYNIIQSGGFSILEVNKGFCGNNEGRLITISRK